MATTRSAPAASGPAPDAVTGDNASESAARAAVKTAPRTGRAAAGGPEKPSARDRLLSAANELFYEEGIHTVGIDRVIERAGVAKATLYSAFGSKDALIRAYLESRQRSRSQRTARHMAGKHTPREQLLAIFDALGESVTMPTYRGCAFANASAEAMPGTATAAAVDEYRDWLHELLFELCREVGAHDPAQLAGQLQLLYDGIGIAARLDHDAAAAAANGRSAADALITAATA